MVQNGRFANAPLLQFVLMSGKGVFNVLNTIVFLGFVASFLSLINASARRIYNSACVLFIAAVWFVVPVFNEGVLWVSGALNYLWAVTFGLLFLVLFRKLEEKTEPLPLWALFLCCAFSIVAGWMHEAVSIGISAALVVFAFLNRKRLSRDLVFVGLAFIAGTALVVFAPGTLNRGMGAVSVGDLPVFFIRGLSGIRFLLRSPICFVLILVGVVAFFSNRVALFAFAKKNIFVISALVALTGFFCFLGGIVAPRGLTAYTVFVLILLFSFPQISTNGAKIFSLVAILATMASVGFVLPQMKTNLEINEAFFATVKSQRSEIVVFDGFETRPPLRFNAGRYLVSYEKGLLPQRRLFYLTRFFNRGPFWLATSDFLSKIYEKDDFCIAENEIGDGFFASKAFPFLVRKATAQDFENRGALENNRMVYSYKINEEKTSPAGKFVAWVLEKLSVLKRSGEYKERAGEATGPDAPPPAVIKLPSGYYQIALAPYDLWERFSSYGLHYELTGCRLLEEE